MKKLIIVGFILLLPTMGTYGQESRISSDTDERIERMENLYIDLLYTTVDNTQSINDLEDRMTIVEMPLGIPTPTHVIDADGRTIGTWDSGNNGVGFITYGTGGGNVKLMVGYSGLPTPGPFNGTLQNYKEVMIDDCWNPTTIDHVTDYINYGWFIKGVLYTLDGSETPSWTQEGLLKIDGDCAREEPDSNATKYNIESLYGLEMFPLPWVWVTQ